MDSFENHESLSQDDEVLEFGGVQATPAERRHYARVDICLPVRYRFPTLRRHRWSNGLVLNLSDSGGAFLVDGAWEHASRVDGSDGFRIELEIGDPYGGAALRLAGSVVWVRPDGGGAEGIDRVGVRFTDPTPAEQRQLERMIGG